MECRSFAFYRSHDSQHKDDALCVKNFIYRIICFCKRPRTCQKYIYEAERSEFWFTAARSLTAPLSCISHWHTKLYLWSFRFRRHTVLTHFSYSTKNICFHIENYYGLMFNVVRFASTSRFNRNKRARNETQLQGQLHIELISFYVLRKCSPLLTTLIDCCWTIIVGASWWECFATSRTHLEALADQ